MHSAVRAANGTFISEIPKASQMRQQKAEEISPHTLKTSKHVMCHTLHGVSGRVAYSLCQVTEVKLGQVRSGSGWVTTSPLKTD